MMSWRDLFSFSTAGRRSVRRENTRTSLRKRSRRAMTLEWLEPRSMLSAGPNFGVGSFAIDSNDDTGVQFQNVTFADNITSVTTPTLNGTVQGYTPGDSVTVNVFVDNGDNTFTHIGSATADTTNDPGTWTLPSSSYLVDLNQITQLGVDGLRTLLATAVDNTDNTTAASSAATQLFLDTNGPRITAVTYHATGQNVFATVPSGPQSNVTQIDIEFTDFVSRPDDPTPFYGTYAPAQSTAKNSAVNQVLADVAANYQLVGRSGGNIPISSVSFTDITPASGTVPRYGKSLVTLTFTQPLASDTYTLSVFDSITNDAGDALDGEALPAANGYLPSGNGFPGGTFSGNFVLQTGASLSVQLTAGMQFGNLSGASTATTMVAPFYKASDAVFAGNFPAANGAANGFSKVAAYGLDKGQYRFLIQDEATGAITRVVSPVQVPGMPVAGEFDGNGADGDEIGIFTGSTWYLLSNDRTSVRQVVPWKAQSGLPVVGHFSPAQVGNVDALSDLATWSNPNSTGIGTLTISFGTSGYASYSQQPIALSFPGARSRPVAVDLDGDKIDDIGLWVPDIGGTPTTQKPGDWYFLPSAGLTLLQHDGPPAIGYNTVHFQWGSSVGMPLTGTFASTTTTGVFPALTAVTNVAPVFRANVSPAVKPSVTLFASPLRAAIKPIVALAKVVAPVNVVAPVKVAPKPAPVKKGAPVQPPTVKTAPAAPTPATMSFAGSAANDTFQLVANSSLNTWTLYVNGVTKTIGSTTSTLNLDGLLGSNTLIITGTGKGEDAELWPDRAVFKSGNLTVMASHVTNVTVNGSGTDQVGFHDAPGANSFVAKAGLAQLTGKGYSLTARGFAAVHAISVLGAATTGDLYETTAQAVIANSGLDTTLKDRGISAEAMYFSKVQIHSPTGAIIKTFTPTTGTAPAQVLPTIRMTTTATAPKPVPVVKSPAVISAALASLLTMKKLN